MWLILFTKFVNVSYYERNYGIFGIGSAFSESFSIEPTFFQKQKQIDQHLPNVVHHLWSQEK